MVTDGEELHGRLAELARLRRFLDSLPASGAALVLRGEPGIGRSSLLRWAAAQAAVEGVRVVAVTAVEDELLLPYAGIRRLVDQLPRAAGSGVTETISAGLPLAKVAVALLAAVGALAAERPVLVIVDDAQWLDQASWAVLAFVARRLTHDPALLLLAIRDGAAASSRLPGSGLAELTIDPLDAERARELLGRRAPGLDPELREQVLALAGGNPLGLVELAATAHSPPSPPADLPLPIRLQRAFTQAVDRLPEPARTLVQVAAFDDGPDGDEIVAAAGLLDQSVSDDDFGPAVAADVLEITAGFRIGFRHPLTRAAVRQATSLDRRRQIHRALSAVLAGDPVRLLRHRASGAPGPDARPTGELTDDARDPAAQAYAGAYLALVEALVRPAGDTGLGRQSADFLTHDLFYASPDRATRDRVVEVVNGLPGPDDDPRKLCILGLVAPLEQHAAVLPAVRQQAIALTAGPAELHLLAQAAFGIGALPPALRLASAAVTGLRAQRLGGLLAQALNLQAALATQLGNVALAETSAAEARQVAVETGQPRWAATAELAAARAAALRGDTRSANALADSAERALHVAGAHPVLAVVGLVRGQAGAAAGLFDAAYEDLRALFDPQASPYHSNLRFWALPFLVEAAVLSGHKEQLGEVMAGLAPLRESSPPILQVGLAYADAVLGDAEEGYLVALAREDLRDWPFELARLQQAYGSWLRHQRRPVEARPLLRSAANTFRVLGATAWAARADAELRASGERTQPGSGARQSLTPQELQIAHLAADGLSNREIATRLGLSPRTIDSHLYRAFRKLGVTSRTQLTKLLVPAPGT